jgi:hypothetical protein
MAVTYTIRNATTTNTAGHGYTTNSGGTWSVSRYYNRFDLTGWDEASSANFNGTTEDGTIVLGWVSGDDPGVPMEP